MTTTEPTCDRQPARRPDGFTLIELLIVIVILGILATVVVFAVGGVTARGETSVCASDERTLATAVEAYFGEFETVTIPATGSGNDRYEATIADAGFLRDVSELWDLDAAGELTPQAGTVC
jgi:prepilin-type N-terminal cleavage/methylation domain-containing protein